MFSGQIIIEIIYSNLNKKKKVTRTTNSAHILSESDEFGTSVSSLETNSMAGSNSEFPLADIAKTNEIKLENLSFHEKLGSGQFGDVYRGSFKKNVIIASISLTNEYSVSRVSFNFKLSIRIDWIDIWICSLCKCTCIDLQEICYPLYS